MSSFGKEAIAEQVDRLIEETRKLADMKPDLMDILKWVGSEARMELESRIHLEHCNACPHRGKDTKP